MRVVLDTNVVVSALIWGGPPFALLEPATERDLLLCTSPILLAELRDMLARPHLTLRLTGRQGSVDEALTLYAALAPSVSPIETVRDRSYLAASRSIATGSQTENVEPLPSSLSISSTPRCRLTMCLTIASPSPVPPALRDRPLSTR